MSRGLGVCQQRILDALTRANIVPLDGGTRSERAALVRAARTLARRGQVIIVRLWNDEHTAVEHCAARPGTTTRDGRPWESLSVARVPGGTGAALTGSIRRIAAELGVSATTVWRDLRRQK